MANHNKHPFTLNINNPCQEDWSSMTKDEMGKFCSTCSKSIIDFTKMTDNEIVQLIEKSNGEICGRFKETQLNRTYQAPTQKNHLGMGKFFGGLLLLATTNNSFAQVNEVGTKIECVETKEKDVVKINKINKIKCIQHFKSKRNTVQGQIIDYEYQQPIKFANINIKGCQIRAVSDSNGYFQIKIPKKLLTDSIILEIYKPDFESKEILVSKNNLPLDLQTIGLISQVDDLGLTGVIAVRKRKWWQKGIFKIFSPKKPHNAHR